jgi:polyhydroxybutyrate depolymerase
MYRDYRLYVPAIYNPSTAVPLVFNFHGYTNNAWMQEMLSDFMAVADTANFIIVHPNGTFDANNFQYWNTYGPPGTLPDDLAFASALLDTLLATYNIDPNRVYCTGMSNGGFMSYDMACFLSHRVAAVASVTGSMDRLHVSACNPQHPLPVMEVHGTADGAVPFSGDNNKMAMDSILKFWVDFNECEAVAQFSLVPDTSVSDNCYAEHHVFLNGKYGSKVELYKIINGGHTWPGATPYPPSGNTCFDFSATTEIWKFFRRYSLNTLYGENKQTKTKLFPNPASTECYLLNLSSDVNEPVIYNLNGSVITVEMERAGPHSCKINLSTLANGVYIVVEQNENSVLRQKLVVQHE